MAYFLLLVVAAILSPTSVVEALVRHYRFNVSSLIGSCSLQIAIARENGKTYFNYLNRWGYSNLQVVMRNMTRLCTTKPIVTVNGKFPGPTLYAREDDTVIVKVVNHVQENVTIHWSDSILFIRSFNIFVCIYS